MSFGHLRSDSNSPEILSALRAQGWLVAPTNRLGGFVDAVVFHPGRQQLRLVEIKTRKGKLRATQSKMIADGWPISVIRSVEEALAL